MPRKPSQAEINAEKAMKANPNFAKDALRAIINETPQLKESLLQAGLVYEVKES